LPARFDGGAGHPAAGPAGPEAARRFLDDRADRNPDDDADGADPPGLMTSQREAYLCEKRIADALKPGRFAFIAAACRIFQPTFSRATAISWRGDIPPRARVIAISPHLARRRRRWFSPAAIPAPRPKPYSMPAPAPCS